jgi:hypothetical protein
MMAHFDERELNRLRDRWRSLRSKRDRDRLTSIICAIIYALLIAAAVIATALTQAHPVPPAGAVSLKPGSTFVHLSVVRAPILIP